MLSLTQIPNVLASPRRAKTFDVIADPNTAFFADPIQSRYEAAVDQTPYSTCLHFVVDAVAEPILRRPIIVAEQILAEPHLFDGPNARRCQLCCCLLTCFDFVLLTQ